MIQAFMFSFRLKCTLIQLSKSWIRFSKKDPDWNNNLYVDSGRFWIKIEDSDYKEQLKDSGLKTTSCQSRCLNYFE